ncbi:clustered mitochondria protein-like [Iris pallida]|uniref:Clustered mitochondria protein-like n=1 Tax=Iris pallida TaxID=29817 RepID=A0AAX6I2V5_IRIPA|nr:clustered mitochondria protein-like [Iris pallida]
MYVHNNIFFSFAVDADLGLVSKQHSSNATLGGAEHRGNTVPLPSSSAKVSREASRTTSGEPDVQNSTKAKDIGVVAESNSSAIAEAQIADTEQATYASANNDLKGTKAYQEADVPGLYNLAMAIIDYRGHRIVAQSIIPGILQGDKSDSLLYGSVDNGKKICWNESFHSKVLEAAKRLHLKEHTVLDGSGNAVKLAAPVECKGIVGSDDRHYLLDLMRVTPRDANYNGPGSRFCVLRPELITSFCQVEDQKTSSHQTKTGEVPAALDSEKGAADVFEASKEETKDAGEKGTTDIFEASKEETKDAGEKGTTDIFEASKEEPKDAGKEGTSTVSQSRMPCEEILLNPNVFTEFNLAGTVEEIAADEASVRKASSYLMDVVLPKFVEDLCALEVSPMDGQTLTDALHAHGINVRYLGKVAEKTKHLAHLWDLCTSEIIVRSTKHILKDMLRESQDHDLGAVISHFFNCFVGNVLPKGATNSMQPKSEKKEHSNHQIQRRSGKGQIKSNHEAPSRANQSLSLTSKGLWSYIQEFARFKYQFELPKDAMLQVRKVSVIRNLCQKVGVSIASRKYDLDAALPFQTGDILNILPVVKHSVPVCSEARDLMETGVARLAEGMLNEAYGLFSEAFSILQQVTGPMHREVANCCRYLAMVLYHAGDMAGAIMQQHKELIINERCLGLDHPDTAHSYGNMALFYHGLSQTELALRHMSRTLLLLSLSSGPDHPDVAATFINIAMMYQDLGKMDTALRYLQEALKKNERLLGPEHIQTAVCYHALAIAFNCMGTYKLSLQA